MKYFLFKIVLVSLMIIRISYPQDYSSANKVSINLFLVLQEWNIDQNPNFSEFSNILSVNYFPERNTKLTLATRYASVGGSVSSLSGLSDTQLLYSYQLKRYNLIFNAGLNLPSGKTKMNQDEFLTSRVISQDIFELRTSNFGQGFNMFLGTTWLHQVSKSIVIGAGISYQIKNEYQPLDSLTAKYKPSNEISITAGIDAKLNGSSTITGDLIGIFYGSDKIDGKEVFATGNRLVASLAYKQYFGFNYFSVLMQYREIALDELKGLTTLIENEKLNPNQFYINFSYNQKLSPEFDLSYGLFGSFYEKTAAFYSGYNLYGLILIPQVKVSTNVKIPFYFKYGFGSASDKPNIQNVEIGTGVNFKL